METLWEGLVAMGFSRRGRAAAGRTRRLTKLAGCVMVVAVPLGVLGGTSARAGAAEHVDHRHDVDHFYDDGEFVYRLYAITGPSGTERFMITCEDKCGAPVQLRRHEPDAQHPLGSGPGWTEGGLPDQERVLDPLGPSNGPARPHR